MGLRQQEQDEIVGEDRVEGAGVFEAVRLAGQFQ